MQIPGESAEGFHPFGIGITYAPWQSRGTVPPGFGGAVPFFFFAKMFIR